MLPCTRVGAQNIYPANFGVVAYDFFFGADDWHHIDLALDHSNQPWLITQAMDPHDQTNYLSHFDGSVWNSIVVPGAEEMHSLFIDQNGVKWIGTSDGIYTYDGITWSHYNSYTSGLTKNDVYCVKTDNAGKAWILSSENSEIYITLWSGNSWQVFSPSETHIDYNMLGEFKLDNLNNFYFNDFYNLVKYDGNSWTVINWSVPTRAFDIDADNNLWYADDPSPDHLTLGEWVNDQWETAQLSNTGAHEAPVWSLVADNMGRKWMVELNDIWIYNGSDGYYVERPGTCAFSFTIRVGSDGNAWGVSTDGFGHCDVYQLSTSTVSVQESSNTNGIEVFPNPASDVLQVSGHSTEPIYFEVKDVFGRTVYSRDFTNSLSIDISQWSSGMYFIYASENDHATGEVLRFLKQ